MPLGFELSIVFTREMENGVMERDVKRKDRWQKEREARWLYLMDKRMNKTREEISQVNSEINRGMES